MVVLGTQVREQLGKLGLPPEALGAQLGGMSPKRLARLGAGLAMPGLAGQPFGGARRAPSIPKAFSNMPPKAALAQNAPFVSGTYASEAHAAHSTAERPLRYLLHPRRSRAARMTLGLVRRPELRERVGTAVGAQVAADGRTDGVVSIERRPRGAARTGGTARGPSMPPPQRSHGTGSIWEIMLAMDEAILNEAARLGLGQGSGTQGTPGFMEAMGLWSLTPDDDDPTAYASLGRAQGGSSSSSTNGVRAAGLTGTVGPENENSGLDVDIMRLKRQIDKKTQMMELYSQTLSKYNSSANSIIANMKG